MDTRSAASRSRARALLALCALSGSSAAPPAAPTPRAALSLVVAFEHGSCEPRGGDHADAALFAAVLPLGGGKGGSGCSAGKPAPSWRLSAPGLPLASSELAGVTNALGVDSASATAWGAWLSGQVGGGPPYRQFITSLSAPAGAAAPSVGWTCHPPVTACGVPAFDRRVARASPLFVTNGSFAVFGDPAADEEGDGWVLGGWERGDASAVDEGVGDGEALLDLLERTAPAGTLTRVAAAVAGASAGPPPRPRLPALPNCTMKRLGAFTPAAPGVQQAVAFDATFSSPSAVTLTLAPTAGGGGGRAVTAQRLSVLSGAAIGKRAVLRCALCDEYMYSPVTVADGYVFLSTINYTTSVITAFSGQFRDGAALSPVANSAPFLPRESIAVALPAPHGAAAPFPLGVAGLQFTTSSDSWACHNKSTPAALRIGSVARAGAALVEQRSCAPPLCALPTDDGGCVVPMFGFIG